MIEREVIVVGAGPSGSAAATVLARSGHDVLLLDRCSFPRDKPCGDGVTRGARKVLDRLGLGDKVEAALASGEFYPIDRVSVISTQARKLTISLRPAFVAPRPSFDTMLQRHAIECGAEFCQVLVREPVLEHGRVVGVRMHGDGADEVVRARIVIGADGAGSTIARTLRPEGRRHRRVHRAIALRGYLDGLELEPHTIEFYFYGPVLPGYGWVFPTPEGPANIGLMMPLDRMLAIGLRLSEQIGQFVSSALADRLQAGWELNSVSAWPLNSGSQRGVRHAFAGALLVGDAAGFADPLTGEGIRYALYSGLTAGHVVHEALDRQDVSLRFLRRYERLCRREMWHRMRTSLLIRKLLQHFPSLLDVAMKQSERYERRKGRLAAAG